MFEFCRSHFYKMKINEGATKCLDQPVLETFKGGSDKSCLPGCPGD